MFRLTLSPSVLPGSGLGYIVGSQVSNLAHDWHWALRVSPCVCVEHVWTPCVRSSHRADFLSSGDSRVGTDRGAAAAVRGPGAEERSRGSSTRASPAPDQLADGPAGPEQEVGSTSLTTLQ